MRKGWRRSGKVVLREAIVAKARRSGRRPPAWAVVSLIVGVLLVLGSGGALVAGEVLQARYSIEQQDLFGGDEQDEVYGEDIEGPLNILLVGVDTRQSRPEEVPLADAIMLVHVPESMDEAYFIPIPRDTLVEIPPFPETGFLGGNDRINAAMSYGARQIEGEELPDMARGFRLLSQTVGDLAGIDSFDGGAVMRFEGFVEIVDALGGVTVELDEEIYSRHRQPDGTHRPLGCGSYCGPQAYYPPGVNELEGWQALDIVRQRYGLSDGDYGRQQNQQLVLEAIMEKAFSRDVVTNPVALDRLMRAGGDAVVFDGRGREPIDFAFALRDVRPGSVVSVTLPAGSVGTGDNYDGEQLQPEAFELFTALQQDRLGEFLINHPDLLS